MERKTLQSGNSTCKIDFAINFFLFIHLSQETSFVTSLMLSKRKSVWYTTKKIGDIVLFMGCRLNRLLITSNSPSRPFKTIYVVTRLNKTKSFHNYTTSHTKHRRCLPIMQRLFSVFTKEGNWWDFEWLDNILLFHSCFLIFFFHKHLLQVKFGFKRIYFWKYICNHNKK